MAPLITYYLNQFDYLNGANARLGTSTGTSTSGSTAYIVGYQPVVFNSLIYSITAWKIARVFYILPGGGTFLLPSSDPIYSIVYNNGDTLPMTDSNGYLLNLFGLYSAYPCFLEGTTILCQVDGNETAVKIEDLRVGNLVKTGSSGYKKVELIGKNEIQNPDNNDRITDRLYKCSPSNYPELTSDLYITGCHSLLVDYLTPEQRKSIIEKVGEIFITENKYRLMACVDERAEPWNSGGHYTVWHLALENDEISHNYGVYVNGGLLAETCSLKHLRYKSNMILYE
jgi:hypothetical protein